MMSSFLNNLILVNNNLQLLNQIYYYHLIVYFFLGNNHNIDYDYNDFYILFTSFCINFTKKIISKEITINQITKDEFINLHTEFINDKNIIDLLKNNNLITLIYEHFTMNKKLKQYIKEFNLYYTDIKYINYINIYVSNNLKAMNICNLFSGFGKFILNSYDINNKYLLVDENEYVVLISYINMLIKYNDIKNVTFKVNNVITDEITNSSFDLVLADLPDDIRNLIYTNCNTKIKFLKIRGTKSEPLILQYISQILNKNGVGIIITPNSLLFGDSQQHIYTRKYILENFGVEVIDLDNKKSILIINKVKSNKIIFKFFENNEVFEYSNDEVIKNNYSFYYYNYKKQNNNETSDFNLYKLDEIINILEYKKNKDKIDDKVLYSYKNNFFSSDIININHAEYLFVVKDNTQNNQIYINSELTKLFMKNFKNILKGKTDQLNVDAIKELQISLPTIVIQNLIVKTQDYNSTIILNIEQKIECLTQLKNIIIKNKIKNSKNIKISEICIIDHVSTSKNTIFINRNTINAGCVNLTTENNETSTNNFYLHIVNNNIHHNYLYFMLLYFENEFINMANNNKTVTLSKKFIENFEIPINDNQEIIINKINQINETINSLLNITKELKTSVNFF